MSEVIRETQRRRADTKVMPWEEWWWEIRFKPTRPLTRVKDADDGIFACVLEEQGIGHSAAMAPSDQTPSIILDEPLTSLAVRDSDLHAVCRLLRESDVPYCVSRNEHAPVPRCALDTGSTPSHMWRVSLDPLEHLCHLDRETTRAFARGAYNAGVGLDVTPSDDPYEYPRCFDLTFDEPVKRLLVDPADLCEIDLYLTWNRIDHRYSIVDTKPHVTDDETSDGERHLWRICVREVVNEGGMTNANDPDLSPQETWVGKPRTLETRAVSKRKAISNVLHRVAPDRAHGRGIEDLGGITWYWKVLSCERLDRQVNENAEQDTVQDQPAQLRLF